MTTTPLMPIAGHTNVTHINDARKLAADVESLGGTVPAALRNLLDAYATLTAPAPTLDPFAAVLDAAAAGKLTPAKLTELVNASAQTRAAEQLRGELSGRRAALALMQRFSRELLNGAADEILNSLRPKFDEAAATIEECLQLVDLGLDYHAFIDQADPDALAAYQRLKPAAATIGEIVCLAMQFGPRSITFPLITRPVEGIGDEEFALTDEAIFIATPEGVRSATKFLLDHQAAVASQRSIKPTNMGMRFSPWLRGGLRLNSVTRECVRVWAEQTWDNHLAPSHAGILHNPYALGDEQRAS
jgi:hypothetical protein